MVHAPRPEAGLAARRRVLGALLVHHGVVRKIYIGNLLLLPVQGGNQAVPLPVNELPFFIKTLFLHETPSWFSKSFA